ncbi:hypothetical protein [Solidesulfovibrio sp.]|uniref:hypothetical protein n=1 Tax=Solidesulfovibrio sp. TaxID=2910990 RepID=UPI002605878A|nr:hypothetical protein [Solidesulfovibrio sp.]
MSNFSEADLPVSIDHEEMVTLGDGTTIRFETNAEAKDLYVGDAFTPTTQLFPGCDFFVDACGKRFKIVSEFEDKITVSLE